MNDKKSYDELIDEYNLINDELKNEIENLKYLLNHSLIEYINLINIHYLIKDLLYKRKFIKDEIYSEYNKLIIDEI